MSVGRVAAAVGCTRRARGELQPGKPFALLEEKRAAAAAAEASDERTSVLLFLSPLGSGLSQFSSTTDWVIALLL